MKNIKFETLKESVRGEKYYMLFKASNETKEVYCIAVQDDDFYIQSVGNDLSQANEIYNLIVDSVVSAIHVNDVISDYQNDMQNQIFAWNHLLLLLFMI